MIFVSSLSLILFVYSVAVHSIPGSEKYQHKDHSSQSPRTLAFEISASATPAILAILATVPFAILAGGCRDR